MCCLVSVACCLLVFVALFVIVCLLFFFLLLDCCLQCVSCLLHGAVANIVACWCVFIGCCVLIVVG